MFYFIFSRNFCRLTFAAAALSIERKENDLQRVLIISVSAAGAANASAMMNDGQLGVSQLFVVCAESEQCKNYCLRILRFSNQSIIASINQSTVNTVSSAAAIAAADAAINLANISLSDSVNSQTNRLPVLRGVFLVNTDLLLYSGIFMVCRCWQGTSSHKESVAQALPVYLFVYYKSYNLVHL